MAQLKTIRGTYGSSQTPCDVFVYELRNGSSWYAVEGSCNVNKTFQELYDGVDVECVMDIDYFNYSNGINSLEELENAVDN